MLWVLRVRFVNIVGSTGWVSKKNNGLRSMG